ncbi:unnamed protein product (macronuclear) [Paramecium tetraurelia]|uniref:Enkurin domain-containing protein n=1 Tax=Paramecium tetraurelia TaxID=5888 RepID=A0BMZ3_PARTE|nr:uncharacterized protein GSPATT00030547001 [Paramecium tetraurelia]CAK59910.1 unnamed protein product [Paramecium tetraurelia]|eukprot:XP_001427308.1 hypothetical protein (macronuclear) [Paramecium tetraurelia strain d4-2]
MNQNTENFFQHMYSKAGKSSSQIFAHLLGKASKVQSIQKSNDAQSIIITPSQSPKKPSRQQPFSLGLSREYLHKLQNQGKPNMPIGVYNPKYSVIQKQRIQLLRKSDLGGKFAVEHKIMIKQGNESQTSIDSSNTQSRRTKGFVDLKRQLSREQSTRQQNASSNVTLNQFISIDTNSIRARPRSAHFKGSGHSLNINKYNCFQSFYDADYEAGKRKISFVGPGFEKQTVRKSLMNKSVCLREQSIYQYDQFSNKNSIVHPNTRNVMIDFKKILGRTYRNEQGVPSHMSKTNRSRIMIETLNQKMLELNASAQ